MASNLSTDSQSSLVTVDELEELEITEFDATMLRELLEEPKEEVQDDKVYCMMQSMEIGKNTPVKDNYQCLDSMIDNIQDVDWLHIMEESPFPCDDIGVWYQDVFTYETSDIVETGEFHEYFCTPNSALVPSDEIAYIGLWEHN